MKDQATLQPFSLARMLGTRCPQITIIDAGAMAIAGEGVEYNALLRERVGRVIGFEPVQSECDKLNAQGARNRVFLPYCVGDGSKRTFHTCNQPMTSSIYEPNTPLLSRFQVLAELTTVVKTEEVQTHRLDDIPEVAGTHLLKMDVQGAELDILRGCEKTLASVVAVHTEVEFLEMYKGQPMFADVDQFLRARGFCFHTLLGAAGRSVKPMLKDREGVMPYNQWIWGTVVYIRDFMRFHELAPEQLLRIAVILHDVYHSPDMAAHALLHYDAVTGEKLWDAYLTRLTGGMHALPPKPPLPVTGK